MIRDCIKMGLDADTVTVEKKHFLLCIPDGEGKNPVQAQDEVCAVVHVGIENDLCVGGTLKGVARACQLWDQFLCIIDFSIVGDRTGTVLMRADHWLCAV